MASNVVSVVEFRGWLNVYINNTLHLMFEKKSSIFLHSYKDETNNVMYCIELHTEKGLIKLEYTEESLWKKILLVLSKINS
jgi:hypothetical protein